MTLMLGTRKEEIEINLFGFLNSWKEVFRSLMSVCLEINRLVSSMGIFYYVHLFSI